MTWLVTLYSLSWILIAGVIWCRPHILFRPTVWLALLFQIVISGAATFVTDDYRYSLFWAPISYLKRLEEFRLAVILFPIASVLLALITPRLDKPVANLLRTIRTPSMTDNNANDATRRVDSFALLAMIAIGVAIVSFYLWLVPLRSTGLWTLVFDRGHADQARSMALTVNNWSVFTGYGYSVLWTSVLAPTCMVFLSYSTLFLGLRVLGIFLILLSVILTGEKSPAALCVLTLATSYILKHGLRRALAWGVLSFGVILTIATTMSILRWRSASDINLATIIEFYGLLLERFFVSPFITGVYTNIFAQDHGHLGVTSIRPLAIIMGQSYLPLPQAAGFYMSGMVVTPPNMNTSFLFDLQASAGIWMGFAISVILIFALDILPTAFSRLSPSSTVAFYSAQLIALISLLSSGYTTSMVSHGIGPIFLIAAIMNWAYARVESSPRSLFARIAK